MQNTDTDTTADFSPAVTQMFDASVRRDYIRFQFCIWGFFWVISLIAFLWDNSPAEIKLYIVLLKTFDIVLMVLCSHILWMIGHRWRWLKRPGIARRRGFIACLIGAAVVTVISFPLNLHVYHSALDLRYAHFSITALIIGHWLGVTIGLAIWGGLYSAYYYQARNRLLETERARLLAATRESQLMSLKGQINPHFLFNSLNTLRALIQREPAAARDAVTRLADMMRFSLTLSDYPVIPLAAELDFVNDYLSLEHLRHEDRLRIQKNITPEALRENIPPMLLQTLVENAVKHGLNQRNDGIDVTCDIWLAPPAGNTPDARANLHLRVTNQGALATGTAPIFPAAAAHTTGTGLHNARERLRLIYGGHASLTVSQQDKRVVAEAIIPVTPTPPT